MAESTCIPDMIDAQDATTSESPGGGDAGSVEELLSRASEIPALRALGHGLMSTTNDLVDDAQQLVLTLEEDPKLHQRVMHLVNTSGYAGRSRAKTPTDPLDVLGSDHIRGLAVIVRLSDLLSGHTAIGSYSTSKLWRHSIWVGVCTRLIARRSDMPCGELAFVAGLMHDIGIFFEAAYAPAGFLAMIDDLGSGGSLAELEKAYLGFDHTDVGVQLANTCGFHPTIVAAIGHHHRSEGCKGKDSGVVGCVEIANVISTLRGVSATGMHAVRMPQAATRLLSTGRGDLEDLVEQSEREARHYESVLDRPPLMAARSESESPCRDDLIAGL